MSAAPTERDASKIAELQRHLTDAQGEIQRRAERLHAVEEQVSQAVGRLQQAHVDLHAQTELAKNHAKTLYQIERALQDSEGQVDPAEILARIRAAVAPPVAL